MIPRRHPNHTRNFGPPVDWDADANGNCATLSVCDTENDLGPVVQSIFEPTPSQLAELNAGGVIVLNIQGTCHPVIGLGTWLPNRD